MSVKVFLVLVMTVILYGCGKERVEFYHKYQVWVGTAAFASGYCSDSYTTGEKFISFWTSDGVKKIVPISVYIKIRERGLNIVGSKPKKLAQNIKRDLMMNYFENDIKQTESLIERDLSIWKIK